MCHFALLSLSLRSSEAIFRSSVLLNRDSALYLMANIYISLFFPGKYMKDFLLPVFCDFVINGFKENFC